MIACFSQSDESHEMIVHAIITALSHDYREHLKIMDSPTNNSGAFSKWDILNRRLQSDLNGSNIESVVVKRGNWEFILLFNYDNKSVLTLMRLERFAQLIDGANTNPLHYLFSMSEINDKFPPSSSQMSFFPMQPEDFISEKRRQIRERLLTMGEENVSHYGIILFSEKDCMVSSVEYRVVNSSLDVLHSESLNKFITIGFTDLGDQHIDMPENINAISRPVLVRRKTTSESDAK